jgi:hypothetical protein
MLWIVGRRSTFSAFVIVCAVGAASAACAVADPNAEAQFQDGGHSDGSHDGNNIGDGNNVGDSTVEDSAVGDTHAGDSSHADTGIDDTGDGVDSTVGVDTGTGIDTAPVDTGVKDTGPKDTGVPDTGPPPTDAGTGVDIVFPKSTDTHVMVYDPYMWNSGDYVQGSRTTSLASATSLSGSFEITNSLASGGFIDIDVYLNSKKVGTFTFSSTSGATIPISLSFPAVVGPTYVIKYLETNTVASGAGSITITYDTAHITLK